jgi:hypothetical protein
MDPLTLADLKHVPFLSSISLPCYVQELGPRFTLKLQALQKGTFDSKGGEFEWLSKKMEQAKRRFFL